MRRKAQFYELTFPEVLLASYPRLVHKWVDYLSSKRNRDGLPPDTFKFMIEKLNLVDPESIPLQLYRKVSLHVFVFVPCFLIPLFFFVLYVVVCCTQNMLGLKRGDYCMLTGSHVPAHLKHPLVQILSLGRKSRDTDLNKNVTLVNVAHVNVKKYFEGASINIVFFVTYSNEGTPRKDP